MSQIKKNLTVSGKRKTAIAKATIKKGSGKILINKKPYENLDFFKKLLIKEPVEIAKKVLGDFDFDIKINVKGGGSESQISAARLALARALVGFTKLQKSKISDSSQNSKRILKSDELKRAFIRYDKNLLIADTRRKEAYKPGDSKARKKRQKSFR